MNEITQQARLLERAISTPLDGLKVRQVPEAWLRIEFPEGSPWDFRFEPGWEALLSDDRGPDQGSQADRSLLSRTLDWFANVSRVLAGSAQAGRRWA
jgi:hypothetical protein